MKFKWRKWNRAVHRDVGYFFAVLSIVYGLSGIALNHIDDWNPNYSLKIKDFEIEKSYDSPKISKDQAKEILAIIGKESSYRKHYKPNAETIRIFIKGGDVTVDLEENTAHMEQLKRRPLFYHMNLLHYNNIKQMWTWFSDLYAVGLILLAITGLFIIRGKNGITRRGAWITVAGLIIPILFLILYL